MDSKLVVEQMSGRWKIKHPDMRPLALEAQALARQFPRISYQWIPREQNKDADRLANEAMDRAAGISGAAGRRSGGDASAAGFRSSGAARSSRVSSPAAPGSGGGRRPGSRPVCCCCGTARRRCRSRSVSAGSVIRRSRPRGSGRRPLRLAACARTTSVRSSARRSAGRGRPRKPWPTEVGRPGPGRRRPARGRLRCLGRADLRRGTQAVARRDGGVAGRPGGRAARRRELPRRPAAGESLLATRLLATYPEDTVLVVSHVTPIKLLVQLALEAPLSALYRMHLDLASLTTVDAYADGPSVLRAFNDIAHLGPA